MVLAVDQNPEGLKTLQEELSVAILVQDVAAEDAANNIVASGVEELGGLDFLINIAGMVTNGTLESLSSEDWQRVMNVNVNSVFKITQQAIPYLRQSNRGRIVNIGSIMSVLAGVGMGAYTASKHAIAGLTKTMALEVGVDGITANYILPGAIVTGITQPAMDADPSFEKFWVEKSPLSRMGQPADIAAGISFLLSQDASFITGHGLTIDGGVMQSA